MKNLTIDFAILKAGGIVMIPLSLLAIIALAIIIDKLIFIKKYSFCPQNISDLIETFNFDWNEFLQKTRQLKSQNCYRRFFEVIYQNKNHPLWWLESRAADEAKIIEKKLNKNLWILETITTASPLLGLLGTIFGMGAAFKIIGSDNALNPAGITAGVAESLVATAFGLVIAIFSLCAFNFFSKIQNQIIDEFEYLGTKIIDHIKLDLQNSQKNNS